MPTRIRDDDGPEIEGVLPGRLVVGRGYDTVRPRGVPEWLLMHTVDGVGRVRPAGATGWVTLQPRSVVAFRPRTAQEYGTASTPGRWDLLWAHVHPRADWLPLLEWPALAPGIGRLDLTAVTSDRVAAALARAVAHHRVGLAQSRALALNAVEEALLWCAAENPAAITESGRVVDAVHRAVVEHVGTHLDAPHDLASLAAAAGVSPSHLGRVIKRETGMSAMAAVERVRLDAARELLDHTDLTVAQVATRVGFADPLYFSRRFRAATGRSPRAWRRRAAPAEPL